MVKAKSERIMVQMGNHQIEKDYVNTNGQWEVTTEGDDEGRTVIHLGTYQGHVDEIALHLADRCYYSLTFRRVYTLSPHLMRPTRKEVSITFAIDSGLWDLPIDARAEVVTELFKDRPVAVKKGQYHASIMITTDIETESDRRKRVMEEITQKLSDEEIEVLQEMLDRKKGKNS